MLRRILLVLVGLVLIGFVGEWQTVANAGSGCVVRDVINFVNRGYSRNKVYDQCNGQIDVRKCSLAQVIRMVEDGYSSQDIYKRCGRT